MDSLSALKKRVKIHFTCILLYSYHKNYVFNIKKNYPSTKSIYVSFDIPEIFLGIQTSQNRFRAAIAHVFRVLVTIPFGFPYTDVIVVICMRNFGLSLVMRDYFITSYDFSSRSNLEKTGDAILNVRGFTIFRHVISYRVCYVISNSKTLLNSCFFVRIACVSGRSVFCLHDCETSARAFVVIILIVSFETAGAATALRCFRNILQQKSLIEEPFRYTGNHLEFILNVIQLSGFRYMKK